MSSTSDDEEYDYTRSTVLTSEDINNDGFVLTSDVDSMVVVSRTLEPFKCHFLARLDIKPRRVKVTENIKMTWYLDARSLFGDRARDPGFVANGEWEEEGGGTRTAPWYEFQLGTVDFWPLHLLFQVDPKSPVLRNAPRFTTTDRDRRLQIAAQAFMLRVIARAAIDLPRETETVRGGLLFVCHNADRCPVMYADYARLARLVSTRLQRLNLRRECGIARVRSYSFVHGMRLDRSRTEALLR